MTHRSPENAYVHLFTRVAPGVFFAAEFELAQRSLKHSTSVCALKSGGPITHRSHDRNVCSKQQHAFLLFWMAGVQVVVLTGTSKGHYSHLQLVAV